MASFMAVHPSFVLTLGSAPADKPVFVPRDKKQGYPDIMKR